MVKCTRCNVELQDKYYDETQVDVCNSCGGILFDSYEMVDLIKKNIADLDSGTPLAIDRKRITRIDKSKVSCPRCSKPMQEFNYGYGQNGNYETTDIVINSCLDCRCLWLDQGEFNAILLTKGVDIIKQMSLPENVVVGEDKPLEDIKQTGQLLCPNCKDVKLRTVEKRGLEVDFCPKCAGMWFDNGEVSQYLSTNIKEKFDPQNYSNAEKDESDRICPKCNIPLSKHMYNIQSNVTADSCLKCNGVWLDRGEFNKIKGSLTGNQMINNIQNMHNIANDLLK